MLCDALRNIYIQNLTKLRQTTDLEIRHALRNEDAHRIEKKQQEDHGPQKRAEALHDSRDNGLEFTADVHDAENPPRRSLEKKNLYIYISNRKWWLL